MENSASRAILLHEKLSSSDTFLLLIGIILYTDAFLSINFGVSLYSIDVAWYKATVSIGDLITYILLFSFLYGAAVPFLLWLIDMHLIPKASALNKEFRGRVRLEKLMRDAIVEGNSAAYKHYENASIKLEALETRRKSCLSIFILTILILGSFSFSNSDVNVFQAFWGRVSGDGIVPSGIRISLFFLSFWFLLNVLSTTDHYSNEEAILGYSSRLESKWISEVTSGLIEKEDLFKHLNETLLTHNFMDIESKYDFDNPSHQFCKDQKLINNIGGKINLTDKGGVFAQYRSLHKDKSNNSKHSNTA